MKLERLVGWLVGHIWDDSWAYLTDGDCLEERVCRRCGVVRESRRKHRYGEWQEPEPRACKQARHRERCSLVQERGLPHTPGDWRPLEGQCAEVTACTRCGQEMRRAVAHQWVGEGPDRRCPRCGASQPPEPEWEEGCMCNMTTGICPHHQR